MLRYAWLGNAAAPIPARLISGMQQSIPVLRQLREIQNALQDNHARVSEQFPDSLAFDGHLPEILGNLSLEGSE